MLFVSPSIIYPIFSDHIYAIIQENMFQKEIFVEISVTISTYQNLALSLNRSFLNGVWNLN